jgi:hypothetical protein
MRTLSTIVSIALLCAAVPCFALTHSHHTSSAHPSIRHASIRFHRGHANVRHEGAPGMDPERASEIQNALIKSGYLTGVPSGVWDSQTAAAMQKLQSDNGWQTKITPDSRALIKLGLGPQENAQITPTSLPQ